MSNLKITEFRPIRGLIMLLGTVLIFVAISNKSYLLGGIGVALNIIDLKLKRR